jgi:lipopolysaccharide transport protein LptA
MEMVVAACATSRRWAAACLLALLYASAALPATPLAGGASVAVGAGIRIEFGRLTEQPGKVLLEQAVITEEDARGNPLKSIRADRAESNSLDVSNSTWVFTGQVTVTIPEGELQADRAQVLILRGLISTATVTGKPASFQQRAAAGGAVSARGRANDISYNAGTGDLVFTGSVWFSSESTGEISSNRATYNIPLRSSSFEKGDNERVHGVIRLKPRGTGEPDKTP